MKSLLLLPGLLCDDAVWRDQIASFDDCRCLVPDYELADSIEAMAARALDRAPERFVLAGHSMGGRVALEIYRQAPERVSHLILLDTGYADRPTGQAGEQEKSGRLALLQQAREAGMHTMGRTWLAGMVHPSRLDDSELVNDILAMIARKTPEIFAAQIEALLHRPDATALLRSIGCPTLLLCGREDSWSPLSRHEEMASLIQGSRLVVIEGAGHMCTMERPQAVTSAIRDWLEVQA